MRIALAIVLTGAVAAGAFALTGTTDAPDAAGAAAKVDLRMSYDDDRGTRRSATLRCDRSGNRATGYLKRRSARRLCTAARGLRGFLTSPPKREICTEIYGGPDRAHVRGRIGGDAVDRRFARRDGCEIDDWDTAQPLLPKPRGADMP